MTDTVVAHDKPASSERTTMFACKPTNTVDLFPAIVKSIKYFIKTLNASFQCLMPCLYIVLYYVVYPQDINAFWNFQINISSVLFKNSSITQPPFAGGQFVGIAK